MRCTGNRRCECAGCRDLRGCQRGGGREADSIVVSRLGAGAFLLSVPLLILAAQQVYRSWTGVLVGLLAALLFAPSSGRELRARLAARFSDLTSGAGLPADEAAGGDATQSSTLSASTILRQR